MIEYLYLGLGLLFGVSITFFRNFMDRRTWPYRAVVVQGMAGANKWIIDKARRVKDKRDPKIQWFQLSKKKDKIPPPSWKEVHIDEKGKNVLPLYTSQEGQYFPLDVNDKTPEINVEDKNVSFWASVARDRIDKTYSSESFLVKYMPLIGMLMVCGMIAFAVIWLGNTMTQMASTTSGNIAASNDVALKLADAIRAMGGEVTPAPIGG